VSANLPSLLALLPTDPLFYAVGWLTAFLMSLSKGAFGGGLASMGVPMLALAIDPWLAAIVLAPLVVFMDLFTLKAFPPSTWSLPDLPAVMVGVITGIALGAIFFTSIDRRFVVLAIALITVWFTARYFLKERLHRPKPHGVHAPRAIGYGALTGFTTFVAHAGGPPLAMYMLRRGFDKTTYAGTTSAVFTMGNLIKMGPYGLLLATHTEALAMALVLTPIVPLGVWLGRRLHDRLSQQQLYHWSYVILALTGVKLLWDAIIAFI
jgi:uncharacterized membrane protein YfcA